MELDAISQLSAPARNTLKALVDGAQVLYRWGRWEAYQEVDGRAKPVGVRLSQPEMTRLMLAVPGIRLEPNPGRLQAFGFAWLPAQHRQACSDALTLTMRTDHLQVDRAGAADASNDDIRLDLRERAIA